MYNIDMVNNRWTTSNKAVYNIGYHLIWCPKYRRPVLVDEVEAALRGILKEAAQKIDVTIEQTEIMPDHVHLFVKSPPIIPPHQIVQQLKGASSRILRKEFPGIKSRLPTLWTRSYYCESVGHISAETVKKYIEDQKGR
jgi:putative transposase